MHIITKLDLLGKVAINRYPYLNRGGCCVYAAMIVSALRKHKIDACGIVASERAYELNGVGGIDFVRNAVKKNELKEWQVNGVSFSHVGVEFKYRARIHTVTKHYDSAGVHPVSAQLDAMPIYKGRLTLQELRSLASKKQGWNDMFDRKCIPELRKLVNSMLTVD